MIHVGIFNGYYPYSLDEVISKAHAAEAERQKIQDVVFDMHGRICSMEQDIKYIKEVNIKQGLSLVKSEKVFHNYKSYYYD